MVKTGRQVKILVVPKTSSDSVGGGERGELVIVPNIKETRKDKV